MTLALAAVVKLYMPVERNTSCFSTTTVHDATSSKSIEHFEKERRTFEAIEMKHIVRQMYVSSEHICDDGKELTCQVSGNKFNVI